MKLLKSELEELVEDTYLKRGENYFRGGLVEVVENADSSAKAIVHGTHKYRVSLERKKDILHGKCNCPAYDDFGPCKHIAALGCALIADEQTEASTKTTRKKGRRTALELIGDYLDMLPAEELKKLIVHEAQKNKDFRKRLDFMRQTSSDEIDFSALRRALRQAIGSGKRFIDYYEAGGWASGIETVLDSIVSISVREHAEEIKSLAEYGMELMNEALGSVDDSNGESSPTHLMTIRNLWWIILQEKTRQMMQSFMMP